MTILVFAAFGRVLLTIAFVAVSILLIGLVLLQKNRGSGLSGALGGVGGHTAFGTKTGDFLTWVTVSLTALFLLLSIVGNYAFEPEKPVAAAPGEISPSNPAQLPPGTPVKQVPGPTATPIPKGTSGNGAPIQLKPISAPPSSALPAPAPTSGPGH